MTKKELGFSVEIYGGIDELEAGDANLLTLAREASYNAYAPYSNFNVGAAALLADGQTVTGSNQENASYPAGICAERVLLSSVASRHPGAAILAIAVSYRNLRGESRHPISPCGICRQSLAEYEARIHQPIRLIMAGAEGEVHILESAGHLLPLAFGAADMA
jgi:cytidine deaminase